MKVLIPVLLSAGLLAGCVENVTKSCALGYEWHDYAVAIDEATPPDVDKKVAFAKAQLDKFCADPANANSFQVARAAASVYVAVKAYADSGATWAVEMLPKLDQLKRDIRGQ